MEKKQQAELQASWHQLELEKAAAAGNIVEAKC